MRVEGIGPPLAVTDTVNATVSEAHRERVLLWQLCPGRIMVTDNLSAQNSERVRKLIEGVGCELVYLPSYSPDFNLIEGAFSKIKSILRKVGAHNPRGPGGGDGSSDLVGQCL